MRIVAGAAPKLLPDGFPASTLRQLLEVAGSLHIASIFPDERDLMLTKALTGLERMIVPAAHHPHFAGEMTLSADAFAALRIELGGIHDRVLLA